MLSALWTAALTEFIGGTLYVLALYLKVRQSLQSCYFSFQISINVTAYYDLITILADT